MSSQTIRGPLETKVLFLSSVHTHGLGSFLLNGSSSLIKV